MQSSIIVLALVFTMSVLEAAPPRIQVHGHRGARAVRPENSLPAFEYAMEAGVDVLELDMAVTKDDVVVVSHDATMNEAYCQGPEGSERSIRKMTLAELRKWDCGAKANKSFPKQQAIPGTRVPALAEVFELVRRKGSRVEFNIETKISASRPELAPAPERFAELVLAVLRKYQMEDRVMVQSFDFRTLHAMKKLAPKVRLSALFPIGKEGADRDFVEVAKEAGAPIISPQYMVVTPAKVAAAHKAGLVVVPWTPNSPADWDKMIAAEVDAIITDDPAELIAYLKSKKLR